MITKFICQQCKETKIELWMTEKPHADDGYKKGYFVCQECRQKNKPKYVQTEF